MPDLKAPLYTSSGAEKGTVDLNPEIFGIEPNKAVMHQVVVAQLAARRSGTATVKTRAQVRGGGRKPWRQKGLGRARHGSIRSPQWVGGGVVHGPQARDYSQRTPKKMKRLAVRSALSARASEGAVKVIDQFDWDTPKTKLATALLAELGATGKALVVLGGPDVATERSFRNLPDVVLLQSGQINTYDVLWSDMVLFSHDALAKASGESFDVTEGDFVKEDESGRGDGGIIAADSAADDERGAS